MCYQKTLKGNDAVNNNNKLKSIVLNTIKHGQRNAIRKTDLARLCGTHERSLRLAIRELIDEGYPICGSPHPPHGYFIADSPEEITNELKLLKHYGMELLRRYSTLRKIKASIILQHPGQIPMKL
jgi:hydrogenase maturation factor